MVARVAAVLGGPRRALALAGLTAIFAAYTAGANRLWSAGLWPDILFIALVLIPATFTLVLVLLPLAFRPRLLPVALALVVIAVGAAFADLDVLFNLAKLFALVLLGFWFLSYFENVAWAALVAVDHSVGRHLVRLLRADREDHERPRERLRACLDRLPRARRERHREPRPT